ncbi:hypothetical protein CAOG_03765 [Capsaspora owczarzaki ATCC 30864]|uniref:Uncharacterized protein n=1 Tax=Capsaspora owczarzaki (strain ATCC 30864) TaxID=595528 RepID=A0A0D2WNS2_CAPO3|nr:hypothetical protein CAOG_03765 [Capsaspora owczarzaki ATCC 30864]KJE92875.1 hypothetical protein CAOG_003765 [Capsaspora owczarzaki ATCC 30864]|eukprot:XP_004363493.1 hypothetical protein CAOG_03765 [Capsaspora owczarzaki ATCC 30864]
MEQAPPTPTELSAKIAQYERFVDDKLKSDLQQVESKREQIYAQCAEYLQLKNSLLAICDATGLPSTAAAAAAAATHTGASSSSSFASASASSKVAAGSKASDAAVTPVKTMVDIGCNYYVQAEIPDPSRVFVKVGFGFYVELSIPEALVFIERKTAQLDKSTEALAAESAKIKANIKLTLQALQDLQSIREPSEPRRDVS